ncbi:MAG: FG-GAP-like repeat-containing protein [Pirellulaceae bacterium]
MKREMSLWIGLIVGLIIVGTSVWIWRFSQKTEDIAGPGPSDKQQTDQGFNFDSEPPNGEQTNDGEFVIPPVMQDVPEFSLTDQSGDSFGSEQLVGKVWVANFIFTRCQATCPAQTSQMRKLQQKLAAYPSTAGVHLLSISVDPEFDTPAVLATYAAAANADLEQWKFLTGERDAIWQLSKDGFHLPVSEESRNSAAPILHDSKFALVDRAGRIRGYYDLLEDDGSVALMRALNFVLPEMAQTASSGETHLAQPPDILDLSWLEDREQQQREASQQWEVFHDFSFVNKVDESGIDFRPQIVDEQRWRLQVNHYDHGNGIVVADVDGDGRLDLYLVAQAGSNGLYRNLGNGKFENITDAAGVGVANRIGVTASFADVDNDADADLFVTTIRGGNILFLNDGQGKFEDVTEKAGLSYIGHSSAALFFDFNRDGLLDLFVTNVGNYTTDEFASLRHDVTSTLPDGDFKYYVGTADAFLGHLKPELSESSILYKNLGGGKFQDVTEEVGLQDDSWSGAATPLDGNGDGWPDLYVLNMQGDDQYYENQQGERFLKKSRELFPKTPWGAMGVKSFDFENDGRFDLLITDMHSDMSEDVGPDLEKQKSDMQWPESILLSNDKKSIFGNAFFKRQSDGTFQERSDQLGAENYWPWGLSVGDLNADGYLDVFIASSMCFPYRYSANSLLLNDRGVGFLDSEFVLGVEPRAEGARIKPWFQLDADNQDRKNRICKGRTGKVTVWSALGSRSSVLFDFDDDGDLDIITNDFNSKPLVLVSNLSSENASLKWLKIKLQGTRSNRDGLGAFVTVTASGQSYYQAYDGQSGYLSQSRKPLYFGLGDVAEVTDIKIVWPSGVVQTLPGPALNQTITAVEPRGE